MNKKLLGLFIILTFVFSLLNAIADSPKMALVEEATNTYCGPCASQNPTFKAWVLANLDILVPVVYHPNWPGAADIFYQDNTVMHQYRVATYYKITGVPYMYLNGTVGMYPANAPAQVNLPILRGMTSPLTMTIAETRTGNSVNVKVTVHSSQKITNKKLRIVVTEYYIQHNAPNGEREFYWIARQMLPDHFGIDFNINEDETKDFNQSFTIRSPWQANQIYVTAFIQDDADKEVLQAASNLKTVKAVLTVDNPYLKIDPSTTITKTVKVENPSTTSISVKLSIPQDNSFIPSGWEAKLSDYTFTLPAKGSKNVTLTIKSNNTAGFCLANILAEPTAQNEIAVNSQINVYALSNNTKNAVFVGSNNKVSFGYNSLLTNATYGTGTAAIPLTKDILINYPLKDFDLIYLSFDYPHRSWLTNGGIDYVADLTNGLMQAVSEGKKILITSELEAYNAGQSYVNAQAKNFLNNTLGVTYNGNPVMRVTVNTQNQIVAINSFPANGFTGDELGNGINMTLNNYTNIQNDPYTIFTEILRSNDPKAVPFLYYDNDQSKVGGLRIINGKSRAVFLSFGMDAISNQLERNQFMGKVLDWLFAGGSTTLGPQIALSASSINFNEVDVNDTKDMTFVIENTGDEDLVVSSIVMDSDYDPAGVFTFKSGATTPFTVSPGSKHNVAVTFKPQLAKEYMGLITIQSNSNTNSTELVSLEGKGKALGPVIASKKEELNFSSVTQGETKLGDVVIMNTGSEDLNISNIEIVNNADGAFSIFDGSEPGIIQPSKDRTISIKFEPKDTKQYVAELTITSNATNSPTFVVTLRGNGITSTVPDEIVSNDGVITLKATPNPMGQNGVISYKLNNVESGAFNMYLVDLSGRIVADFVNANLTTGNYTYEFNTSELNSGTYFIIASINNSTAKLPVVIVK